MAPVYFDFQPVARDAGLSATDLLRLEGAIRAEFPADDMLFELHMLRACVALRDGFAKLTDVVPADAALATATR